MTSIPRRRRRECQAPLPTRRSAPAAAVSLLPAFLMMLLALTATTTTTTFSCEAWVAAPPAARTTTPLRRHRGYRKQGSGLCAASASTSDGSTIGGPPLPENYKEVGTDLILKAARTVGAADGQVDVQWKGDRIVVTVTGDGVYVSDPVGDSGNEDGVGEDEDEGNFVSEADDEEEVGDVDNEEEEDGFFENPGEQREGGVDVTVLARAINAALDDGEGGVGTRIAETHSVEVTTPGASDVLVGQVMFEAYRGFDVACTFNDTKKNKKKNKANESGQEEGKQQQKQQQWKTIEGRLVERNDEYVVLNLKGRMKKVRNEDVVEVRLPKAKREKGR